ncbi:MAG: sialate O-acetylesterase [Leptospiraceae bacterium]
MPDKNASHQKPGLSHCALRNFIWALIAILSQSCGETKSLHLQPSQEAQKRALESSSSIQEEHQGELHLFILAGQSNMSGRGNLENLQHRESDPAIYVFGNDYRWKVAQEPVDDPQDQLDLVSRDSGAGVGPSLAFASELRKNRSDAIGLIPCAMGATTMFEWERRLSPESLYGSCLQRSREASKMGRIKAVLFFQGEWDALDIGYDRLLAENHRKPEKRSENRIHYSDSKKALPAGMSEYQLGQRKMVIWPGPNEKYGNPPFVLRLDGRKGYNRSEPALWAYFFADFVDNIRHDLKQPELPVVFAQIGTQKRPEVYRHWTTVKKAQDALRMDRVTMIRTDDLSLKDSVHFSAESYIEIGKRFARAYLDNEMF